MFIRIDFFLNSKLPLWYKMSKINSPTFVQADTVLNLLKALVTMECNSITTKILKLN